MGSVTSGVDTHDLLRAELLEADRAMYAKALARACNILHPRLAQELNNRIAAIDAELAAMTTTDDALNDLMTAALAD